MGWGSWVIMMQLLRARCECITAGAAAVNPPPSAMVVPALSSIWQDTAGVLGSTTRETLTFCSLSLVTVKLLVEVGLLEHTPGAESRATVTTGLTKASTVTCLLLVSPQLATPGVSVLVSRVRTKVAQVAGSAGLVQRTVTVVSLFTAWHDTGDRAG